MDVTRNEKVQQIRRLIRDRRYWISEQAIDAVVDKLEEQTCSKRRDTHARTGGWSPTTSDGR
jgi:hypothetical protein